MLLPSALLGAAKAECSSLVMLDWDIIRTLDASWNLPRCWKLAAAELFRVCCNWTRWSRRLTRL